MDRFRSFERSAPDGLAAMLVVSGGLHLFRHDLFHALIPPFLPAPHAIIAVSGIAELVCAAGLLRRERWAGPASALLLVAVFPGNVWFAIGAPSERRSRWFQVAALLRLPLQIPLIAAALAAGRPRHLSRHRRG